MWTHVGFFLAGGAFGGGVTFVIFNNRNKAAYQRQVEDEVAAVEASYERRLRDELDSVNRDQPDTDEADPQTVIILPAQETLDHKSYVEILETTGYNQIAKPVTREDLIDYRGDEESLVTIIGGPDGMTTEQAAAEFADSKPYLISLDDYMSDETDHEAVTMMYYALDRQLVDDSDSIILDIEQTVGYDNLEKFGENSRDENTVYIRNDKKNIDIELHQIHEAYAQAVLGLETYEDAPAPRRNGRMREDD